jgi:hypothetical protein
MAGRENVAIYGRFGSNFLIPGRGREGLDRRFSLISVRLGEGRLTSRQRSLSVPHGNWLPTAFADRLRRQLPWPILPWRALKRLWPD